MHTIQELDRRAVLACGQIVAKAGVADLDRRTPCDGWTLGDLLAHMTAQHHGFAAAARGNGADLEVWRVRPLGDQAVSAYAEASEDVVAAFAEKGVLERDFALPELRAVVPGAHAIGFHFIDYIVHGWDVARALGLPYAPDPGLLEAALPIAQAVPDGPERREPGASFAPGLVAPGDATTLDRILALLGRSPHWPARQAGQAASERP